MIIRLEFKKGLSHKHTHTHTHTHYVQILSIIDFSVNLLLQMHYNIILFDYLDRSIVQYVEMEVFVR